MERPIREGIMRTISFSEARTHLSDLLDQVAKGKRFLITRRGKPAALLGPPPPEAKQDVEAEKDVAQVIKEMRALREHEGPTLGDLTIRELIEEGRRF